MMDIIWYSKYIFNQLDQLDQVELIHYQFQIFKPFDPSDSQAKTNRKKKQNSFHDKILFLEDVFFSPSKIRFS